MAPSLHQVREGIWQLVQKTTANENSKKHFCILWTEILKNETQNVPLIWFPMTNYMAMDQTKMAMLWQSWGHARAWDVKGERPRKCCSNNVNEQDWWWTPREQGCCYILSFSYLFLVIISHWTRSALTQIWAIVPSVVLYQHWQFWVFYTSGKDLEQAERGKIREYLHRHIEEVRQSLQNTKIYAWLFPL